MTDTLSLVAAFQNPNVQAFWRTVRFCEGTGTDDSGYSIIFGGGHFAGLDGVPGTFDDFADHPRKKVTRTMKGKEYTSSAAGAVQWMPPTWDEMAAKYGLKDFSPANQDIGFVGLLIKRKALNDVIAGRFEQAIHKCRWEWASLPGSPYGQPIKTMEVCRAQYEKWGGTYSTASPVKTPPQPTVEPQPEKTMALPSILAALLPSLITAVPELTKIFGSGSAVSERNVKAVEVVANVAKEALGAKNEQEVIEQMASDPVAVVTVRDAIKDNWYQINEVGGGIQAAREANLKAQGDRSIAHNPAVWISAALLLFPLLLCVDLFFVHPDAYDGNLRTQIVTAFLATIMMVGAYWLGTTSNSGKKDETIKSLAGQ